MKCETCAALDKPLSAEYIRYFRIESQMRVAEALNAHVIANDLRRDLAESLARRKEMKAIRDEHLAVAHPELGRSDAA